MPRAGSHQRGSSWWRPRRSCRGPCTLRCCGQSPCRWGPQPHTWQGEEAGSGSSSESVVSASSITGLDFMKHTAVVLLCNNVLSTAAYAVPDLQQMSDSICSATRRQDGQVLSCCNAASNQANRAAARTHWQSASQLPCRAWAEEHLKSCSRARPAAAAATVATVVIALMRRHANMWQSEAS
jgi:hypothetical protein